MASLGYLTKSGLLYEDSDFTQWEANLRTRMCAEGLEDVVWSKFFGPCCSDERRKLAIDLVRMQLCPELRKRVQHMPHVCPSSLRILLRQLSQPFRLLDLPPELRNRIYDYTIPENSTIELAPIRQSISGYQSITAASRQLRAEVLPTFYAQSTLQLNLLWKGSPGTRIRDLEEKERVFDFSKGVKACVKRLGGEHLKHLRKAQVLLSIPKSATHRRRIETMTFTFHPSRGLQIQFSDKPSAVVLSTESQQRLEDQVKKTEEIRSMLGLQGEAILLALTSDEGLWEEGVLNAK